MRLEERTAQLTEVARPLPMDSRARVVGTRDELTYVLDYYTRASVQIQIQVDLLGDDFAPGMARLIVDLEGLLDQETLRRLNHAEEATRRLRLFAYELEHGPSKFGPSEQAKIDEVRSVVGPGPDLSYAQDAYAGIVCIRGGSHTLRVRFRDRRYRLGGPLGPCIGVDVEPAHNAQLVSAEDCLAESESLARTATLFASLVDYYQLNTEED